MKVLIMYECLPEENFYLLVDVTREQWNEIKHAHGYTIGLVDSNDADAEAAVLRIGDACLKSESKKYANYQSYAGIWHDKIIKPMPSDNFIDISGVDKLIVCGIVM